MGFDRSKADFGRMTPIGEILALERIGPSTNTIRNARTRTSTNADTQAAVVRADVVLAPQTENRPENGSAQSETQVDIKEPALEQVQESEQLDGDSWPPVLEDTEDNAQVLARPPSPVPTEVVPVPEEEVKPFETIIEPGVIARDYAFHPTPMRPPLLVFPILTSYIWFHYNRWRHIKQKPPVQLNALQSAFVGCELVYLMHFNWISMKEISWLDACDWLGQGLIYLYENPRDVEITYGAKRPSPKSPFVTKWFSRFAKCSTIQYYASRVEPRRNRAYERKMMNFYGPFGEQMHRYFTHEETAAFRPLYNYLVGKGAKPQLSEKMESIFKPILHCHGGGVGGRGTPHERPQGKDNDELHEGIEQAEVDIDPVLYATECSKVPAFVICRVEHAIRQNRALRQLLHEEEESEANARARGRKKCHKWTHKKSHKSNTKVAELPVTPEIIDIEAEPGRRCTRSMVKAATEAARQPQVTPQTNTSTRREKGKAKALPLPEEVPTSPKRKRDEDDDSDVEYLEQAPSEPGPSSRPARRIRRKVQPLVDFEPPSSEGSLDSSGGFFEPQGRETTTQGPRGTKRHRSLTPEPSEGPIDAIKRRRLDEAGSSERLAIPSPPAVDEQPGTAPTNPEQVTREVTAEVEMMQVGATAPESAIAEGTVEASQLVPPEPDVQNVAIVPNEELQPTPPAQDPLPEPQLPMPPPPDQLMPPPPPPQVPPAPRPLRRTETLLIGGYIHRPNW